MIRTFLLILLPLLVSCGESGTPIDVAVWDKETQALPGPQRIIDWPDVRQTDDRRQRNKWGMLLIKDGDWPHWLQKTREDNCGNLEDAYVYSILFLHEMACGVQSAVLGFERDALNYHLPIMSCEDRVERDEGRGVPKRMLMDGIEVETPFFLGLDELNDFDQGGDSFIGVASDAVSVEKPTDIYLEITFFDGQTRLTQTSIPEPPTQCALDINFQEACGIERSPLRMMGSSYRETPLNKNRCCELNIDPSYPECQG
jgi:hypothetical protein